MLRHCRSAAAKSTHVRLWDRRPPPAARLADPCRQISVHRRGAQVREVAIRKLILAAVVSVVPLAGCADTNPAQQRALCGTAIGAGGGAIIGAIAGNAGLGAGIGAAAGLAGGLIYDQVKGDRPLPIRRVIRPEAKAVRRIPRNRGSAHRGGSALGLPFPARRAAPGEAIVASRRLAGNDDMMPHQVAGHAA